MGVPSPKRVRGLAPLHLEGPGEDLIDGNTYRLSNFKDMVIRDYMPKSIKLFIE